MEGAIGVQWSQLKYKPREAPEEGNNEMSLGSANYCSASRGEKNSHRQWVRFGIFVHLILYTMDMKIYRSDTQVRIYIMV